MKSKRNLFMACMGVMLSIVAVPGIVLGVSVASGAQATRQFAMPAGLTKGGQLLWNFESLLRSTYGAGTTPWTSTFNTSDFVCAGESCGPLSKEDPYFYTFSDLGKSDLTLVKAKVQSMNFGNYPVPIVVDGYAVACNTREHLFLVRFSDAANFSLSCAPPIP